MKDTFYFSHDYYARNDRKIIRLRLKLKMEGLGIYWSLVEMLYEEGGKIPFSDIPTIAEELRVKQGIIDQVLTSFDLFENDGHYFWSNSVKRRLDKRLEKSEKAKASASHRWQNANAMRTHTDGNAIKERKGKESKRNIESADAPHIKSFKQLTEKEFYDEIATFSTSFPKDLLRAFYDYWSEKSPSGKMKFQLEATWELKKRLDKWKSNQTMFTKKPTEDSQPNLNHHLKKIS